jgi:hypothetical protein
MAVIFDPTKPAEGTRFKSPDIRDNFNALSRANDLRPSEQSSPNLTVLVQSGRYLISSSASLDFPGGNSPTLDVLTSGVPGQSRIAVLHVDGTGTLSWKYESWSTTPVVPAFDGDKIAICEVTFTYGAPAIVDSMITDVRPFVNLGAGDTVVDPNEIQFIAQLITFPGQKDFDTSAAFTYTPGEHEILVWHNGVFQQSSGVVFDPTKDYQELDSTTVRFNVIVPQFDTVVVWRVGLAAPSFSMRDLSDISVADAADGGDRAAATNLFPTSHPFPNPTVPDIGAPSRINPFLTVSGHALVDHSTITPINTILTDLSAHFAGTGDRHTAADIDAVDNFSFSNAVDVQGVLDDINTNIYLKFVVEHNSDGTHGPKVTITQTAADNALNISKTHTGGGDVVNITNNSTASCIDIMHNNIAAVGPAIGIDNSSSSADGISIVQIGNRAAININKTHTGSFDVFKIQNAGTGDGIEIVQSGNGRCLELVKTNTGSSDALRIDNSGSGDSIRIDHQNDARGIYIVSTGTGSNNRGLRVDNAGISDMVFLNRTGTGGSSNAVLKITNNASLGTAKDIEGNSGTWNVDKSGVGTFTSVVASNITAPSSKLILTRGGNLTISSGAITVTHSYHRVDTEAAAASDNLDTINGGVDGMIVVLQSENSARDVLVRDGIGNIFITGNTLLVSTHDKITLIYNGSDSMWNELSDALSQ